MTIAEKKNFALDRIGKAGVIDMYSYNKMFDSNEWFNNYSADFLARNLIEVDKGGTPGHYYYKIALSVEGEAFLANGGYVAEEAKQKQDDKDKALDRWSKKGNLRAVWVFGILTAIATFWSTYLNRDKNILEQELKERNEQIRKLDNKVAYLDSILKIRTISPKHKKRKIKYRKSN